MSDTDAVASAWPATGEQQQGPLGEASDAPSSHPAIMHAADAGMRAAAHGAATARSTAMDATRRWNCLLTMEFTLRLACESVKDAHMGLSSQGA